MVQHLRRALRENAGRLRARERLMRRLIVAVVLGAILMTAVMLVAQH
jgi:hypothetical protein